MEELKTLLGLVKDLPNLAIWGVIAFFVYKLSILGSVYGVIRYVSGRYFDYKITQKLEIKNIESRLDGMVITGNVDKLIDQIHRVAGKGTTIQSSYLHDTSIKWLRDAIDDKIIKDSK